ncbi:MAG TPA: PDR/VanB family oxidoreductase [Baekduia sp.]|uniref:PDR/VanB family oxidoreductase n=1 Tax=Baekduia sp. TaxID=2600305 RepID=UPI002D776904|nr:PDR/VanB family oxidoreductase [Baekduia sp.]HET6509081.1 PDR/VanB family oxidoreductase [Baekduia sp.]
MTLRVLRRLRVADDVLVLDLGADDDAALPAWEPGAHIDVRLGNGLTRQYSLCGDPAQRSVYRIAVLREAEGRGRGGSAYVHDRLHEDARVEIGGPRNHFRLEPAARHRFVAGGIGITPIIAMIGACRRAGTPWSLDYGGRARSSMAFLDALPESAHARIHPEDTDGPIDVARALDGLADDELVYVCGPTGLISAVTDEAARRGRADAVRYERFAADGVAPLGDGETAEGADGAFEVVLAQTGTTLTVGADQTVLECLRAAGVDVFTDCEEGLCGSCECQVLEGEVDHRDHVLTRAERAASRSMMVCVSRAKSSRLVLDT